MSRLPMPQLLPPQNKPRPWLADLQLNVVQATIVTTPTFDVVQLTKTAILNPNLIIIRISIQGMGGDKINGALQAHREYFLPLVIFAVIQPKVGQTISEHLRPDFAIAKKIRAQLPESAQPAAAATGEVGLLKVAPDFPEPMFDALATQSLDLIMPGLDKFPLNRCGLFESNQAFIEAYMVGLNHEMSREMLWREFPADLRQTFFRQFWDKSDTPAGSAFLPAAVSQKDIRPISDWAKPTSFGDARIARGRPRACCFLPCAATCFANIRTRSCSCSRPCVIRFRRSGHQTIRSRSKCPSLLPGWNRTSSFSASTSAKPMRSAMHKTRDGTSVCRNVREHPFWTGSKSRERYGDRS